MSDSLNMPDTPERIQSQLDNARRKVAALERQARSLAGHLAMARQDVRDIEARLRAVSGEGLR